MTGEFQLAECYLLADQEPYHDDRENRAETTTSYKNGLNFLFQIFYIFLRKDGSVEILNRDSNNSNYFDTSSFQLLL